MLTLSFAPGFNATAMRLLSKVSLVSLGYILWSAECWLCHFHRPDAAVVQWQSVKLHQWNWENQAHVYEVEIFLYGFRRSLIYVWMYMEGRENQFSPGLTV